MNGKERIYWCENLEGHLFLTHPEAPIPPGFSRFETTTPSEMDKIFKRLDHQTKMDHEQLTEALFNERKDRIAKWRSDLNYALTNAKTVFERAFIKAALRANEKREEKLNRNSVYGVSAMQTTEAPLPPSPPQPSAKPSESEPVQ